MNVSSFKILKDESQQYINKAFNQSDETKQIIYAKNLFSTLKTTPRIHYNVAEAFQILNAQNLQFGSSSLYLKEMRHAVKELLKEFEENSVEKEVLHKWLAATKSAQEMTWVNDYFRARMPFVAALVLKGQDPTESLKVKCTAPFNFPSSSELETVNNFIVDQVKQLKPGCCFAIPAGSLFHDTMLLVEKNLDGSGQLFFCDPNRRIVKKMSVKDPHQFSDCSFWKKISESKFQNAGLSNLPIEECPKDYEPLLLREQKGQICFGHSHWSLLRLFILRHSIAESSKDSQWILTESFPLARKLEFKIREKMIQLSRCQDPSLRHYVFQWLEKKKLKQELLDNFSKKEAYTHLIRLILDHCPENGFRKGNHVTTRSEQIENFKYFSLIDKDHPYRNYRICKFMLHIAKWAYFNMSKQDQEKRSFCSLSQLASSSNLEPSEYSNLIERIEKTPNLKIQDIFFKFLKAWNQYEKTLENSFVNKTQESIDKIEENYGWISSTLSAINGYNRVNRFKVEAYLNNVAGKDYYKLCNRFPRFLLTLKTPAEVLYWTKKMVKIVSHSSTLTMFWNFYHNMKSYLENSHNQFDSNSCVWSEVRDEIDSLLNEARNSLKTFYLSETIALHPSWEY